MTAQDTKAQLEILKHARKFPEQDKSIIHLAKYNGQLCVYKVAKHLINEISNEAQMLCNLDHPNVVKLISAGKSSLLLEYCEIGDITNLDIKRLTWLKRIKILLAIAGGLRYLHEQKVPIIHQDIKPDNIFVCKNGAIKIGDFGTATYFDGAGYCELGVGTCAYRAPEYLQPDNKLLTPKVDIYSFGGVIYALLTNRIPWTGYSHEEIIKRVAKGMLPDNVPWPEDAPKALISLYQVCWQLIPRNGLQLQ